MSNGDSPTRLTGDDFRAMVAAGTRCLEQNADAINALNVFPVPDGDTGINMLLTLRSANDSPELPPAGSGTVAQVSHGLARGALLGARGNSGVIFSQFMKGLSLGLADCEDCGGADLGSALATGSAGSYQAVGKPVEGTMLSVMRAAAQATEAATAATPAEILRIALEAAQWALEHTPEQLPILKEAGVVDAGGQGVVAFLAGALGHLEGKVVHLEIAVPASSSISSVSHDFLGHTEEEMYGYCTQFIIQGDRIDVDTVRERVMAMAGSTVVVGDDRTVRVHAHAEDPGPVLSLGTAYGVLDQINIQNMDQQHEQFMVDHGYKTKHQGFAIVAVATGKGIESVFSDLGASAVVHGGQTMNPSASDLLDAVERANLSKYKILDLTWFGLDLTTPKTNKIGKAWMSANRHRGPLGQTYGRAHYAGITRVRTARDIGRGDILHHRNIIADRVGTKRLTEVAVEVNPLYSSRQLEFLGHRSQGTRHRCWRLVGSTG